MRSSPLMEQLLITLPTCCAGLLAAFASRGRKAAVTKYGDVVLVRNAGEG